MSGWAMYWLSLLWFEVCAFLYNSSGNRSVAMAAIAGTFFLTGALVVAIRNVD